ncbi:hypothetical protein BJX99DRAFT_252674 [Aspergillus californicus]
MYKLIYLALLISSVIAVPQENIESTRFGDPISKGVFTTMPTIIGDTFPSGPSVTSTIIGDTFPEETSIASTTIGDTFPDGPFTTMSIIADPTLPAGVTFGDPHSLPTSHPSPDSPRTMSTIIADPPFGPSSTPLIGGGSFTTSTIIADPSFPPSSSGPSTTSTSIDDPGFTDAASSLNAPIYAVAGILAGVAMI